MGRDDVTQTKGQSAAPLQDRRAVAREIRQSLDILALVANENDMPMLSYYLRLCQTEAECVANGEAALGQARSSSAGPNR